MSKIIIKKMSFDYDGKEVFDNINLEIDRDWRVALIGKNGRGKTTLLKLISKKLSQIKGEIIRDGEISYFPFEVKDEEKNVLETIKEMIADFFNMEKKIKELLEKNTDRAIKQYGEIEERYRELGGYDIEAMIKKEIKELDLEESILDKKYKILSGGEKTKLMLIALFLKKENYILIDEPTNHLDIESREKVAKYLSGKKGFICASHDRYFLDQVADHVISIEKTGIEIFGTSYSNWESEKRLKEESEIKTNEKLKKDITKMNKSMLEKEKWSDAKENEKSKGREETKLLNRGYIGRKAAKLMKKAKNIETRLEKQIDDKKKLLKNYEKEYELKFIENKEKSKRVLVINNLNISYDNKKIIKNFDLKIERGERVAILGKNGSGKTSIFKAILGEIKIDNGRIYIPADVDLAEVKQESNIKFESLEDYIRDENMNISEFRNILACLGVKENIFYKKYSEFSQGEKKKIQLAKVMLNPASLFLWDEALNYLDISARENLEKAILKYKPTILFVEHDKYFIEKIATSIIEI